ncbi:MAG TPA: thioredoxin domain-containing protein, partial [Terriglobales bacterium]
MAILKVPVTSADHIQGEEDAPVTLVEYGDYECPHCGRAYGIIKRVQKHFGRRLRFVFRNFPLNESHPNAENAAESSEFAAAHGRFWEMHDLLYENQEQLSLPALLELAESLGLSGKELHNA